MGFDRESVPTVGSRSSCLYVESNLFVYGIMQLSWRGMSVQGLSVESS